MRQRSFRNTASRCGAGNHEARCMMRLTRMAWTMPALMAALLLVGCGGDTPAGTQAGHAGHSTSASVASQNAGGGTLPAAYSMPTQMGAD